MEKEKRIPLSRWERGAEGRVRGQGRVFSTTAINKPDCADIATLYLYFLL